MKLVHLNKFLFAAFLCCMIVYFKFLNYHFKNIRTVKVIGFPKSLVNILFSRSRENVTLQTNETYCYSEVVSRCAFCIFWTFCSVNHLSGPLRACLHGLGDPGLVGWFLLFSRSGGHTKKETYPTGPGFPAPCKQGLRKHIFTGMSSKAHGL